VRKEHDCITKSTNMGYIIRNAHALMYRMERLTHKWDFKARHSNVAGQKLKLMSSLLNMLSLYTIGRRRRVLLCTCRSMHDRRVYRRGSVRCGACICLRGTSVQSRCIVAACHLVALNRMLSVLVADVDGVCFVDQHIHRSKTISISATALSRCGGATGCRPAPVTVL